MKKPLIIGSNGQLARSFKAILPDVVYLDRSHADLSHPHKLEEVLEQYNPSLVINTAAYTQVDNAEKEEHLATVINAESPAAMAIYCNERDIPFIHFSTDYVFDGSGEKAWQESDIPAPLNAYGRSKLAGEEAITHIGGKYLIFRTSWLYDAHGKNFPNTILRLAGERDFLRVIDDQFGAPTYTPHLAKASLDAIEYATNQPDFPSGVYNLCNEGETSWFGFACAIVNGAKETGLSIKTSYIEAIPASEYPLPAKRPHNSRLNCSKARDIIGISMPNWRDGVKEFFKEKNL